MCICICIYMYLYVLRLYHMYIYIYIYTYLVVSCWTPPNPQRKTRGKDPSASLFELWRRRHEAKSINPPPPACKELGV